MLTIFLRTVIIYVVLLIIMRLMGKRQLGELEINELIITFLLSEIASMPITNIDMPISYAIIPIVTLASLEIASSFLAIKFPKVKRLLSSRPSVIIIKGRIDRREMMRVRISIDELISQIRQNGIFDLDEVDYAILEENGKMSIIPKHRNRQPDFDDLNVKCQDSGVMHVIISDGSLNQHNLTLLNLSEQDIYKKLNNAGLYLNDVLCMTINDAGATVIVKQDGTMLN